MHGLGAVTGLGSRRDQRQGECLRVYWPADPHSLSEAALHSLSGTLNPPRFAGECLRCATNTDNLHTLRAGYRRQGRMRTYAQPVPICASCVDLLMVQETRGRRIRVVVSMFAAAVGLSVFFVGTDILWRSVAAVGTAALAFYLGQALALRFSGSAVPPVRLSLFVDPRFGDHAEWLLLEVDSAAAAGVAAQNPHAIDDAEYDRALATLPVERGSIGG